MTSTATTITKTTATTFAGKTESSPTIKVLANDNLKNADAAYLSSLAGKNVEPLWTVLDQMVPPNPNPGASVLSWPYGKIRPSLMESGHVVSAEEAQRRVLMLVNPSLSAPCTTDTIYAGLQLILPGETAPAHRHVAFALRFIIEGQDGFTAVEGQKIMMEKGDVILTPSWHWHDHGNEGTGPMVWLDGLDLPVYKFLRNNFAENYAAARYPSEKVETSNFKFPWAPVAAALDASDGPYSIYHYKTEAGLHLSKTLSAQAERVSAGTTSPESQETTSFVYHVYEGKGYSTISFPNGTGHKRIDWEWADTFCVPSWCVISHTCTSEDGSAYLFAVNDRPMLESLGSARTA